MNKFGASGRGWSPVDKQLATAFDCLGFSGTNQTTRARGRASFPFRVHFWTSLRKKLVYAPPPPK